jgi:ATP-binding cassette subfamily B (MDR/TAP) protein 1
LVQQGISEKVPVVISFLSGFVTGFGIAYIRSWRLALALSSILPCLVGTGAIMNKTVSKYTQYVDTSFSFYRSLRYHSDRLSLIQVGEGGSLAEEVFGTVRTAQAFGSQKILSGLYDAHVEQSFTYQLRSALFHGCGMAIFFFVLYVSYALGQSHNSIILSHLMILLISAFSFGTTLINQGYGEIDYTCWSIVSPIDDNSVTPGAVVNVLLAIIMGTFSLVLLAPEMQGNCVH